MPADALRITDGQSHCRLPDASAGMVEVPLVEIGMHGALLQTDMQLEDNAYLDVTLVLRNMAPKQLFANVVSCKDEGLRVKWLHFDPGEEGKLRSVLESYAKALAGSTGTSRRVVKPKDKAPATTSGKSGGTRRLVRPTASAITPFSDPSDSAAPATPSGPAATMMKKEGTAEKNDAAAGARVGTRRVVRPSQQAMTPFGDEPTNDSAPMSDDTRGQVIIEQTDQFDKLIDEAIAEDSKSKKGSKSAAPKKDGALSKSVEAEIVHTPFAGSPTVSEPSSKPAQRANTEPTPSGETAFDKADDKEDSGAQQTTGPKTTVVGKDGRMDIGASIRTHAKTVRASDLAARHDRVRVLNMATIKGLIQEAVEEAATHLTRSLGEAERKRLLEEAEEGFQERLKSFQAEKQSAEERAKRLNEQLESARNLLEEERKRTISADQFTVSAEGLGEIEDRFKRFLDRTMAEGKVPADVEEELRKTISRILDSEREKIREREMEAQNAKIELLERKISRLAGSLEESERQRDDAQRFAAFLEQQGGGALRNVYTAGMKDGDPNKEKKMALMKNILEENRALRASLGIDLNKVEDEPEKPKAEAAVSPAPVADVPADEVVPDTEAEEDDSGGEGESSEPESNPDDEIWEVKPLDLGGGTNEHGIKRMDVSAVIGKGPPPLERK